MHYSFQGWPKEQHWSFSGSKVQTLPSCSKHLPDHSKGSNGSMGASPCCSYLLFHQASGWDWNSHEAEEPFRNVYARSTIEYVSSEYITEEIFHVFVSQIPNLAVVWIPQLLLDAFAAMMWQRALFHVPLQNRAITELYFYKCRFFWDLFPTFVSLGLG